MDRQEKFFDMPVEFSFEGWQADLQELFSKEEATQWDIGDLLLAAEDVGGLGEQEDWTSREAKKFRREAVRITKKSWRTLKNYKSISRKFPKHPKDGSPSLRSDTLSYGVHVLVAPFSREHQVRLLEGAEKRQVRTVNDMRELIKREQKWGGLPKTVKGNSPPPAYQQVKVTISGESYEALQKIARVRHVGPHGGGSLVADVILWMVEQYCNQHKEALKADIKALEDKEMAALTESMEEDDRVLEQMEAELAADIDNKIPSY